MAVLAARQPSFAKSLLYEDPAQGTYNERLMINGYIAMNALRSQDTMVENTQSISWMHYEVWKASTSNITNCLKHSWTGQHIVNFAWVGNTLTIVCQRVPSRTGGGNWITNEANGMGTTVISLYLRPFYWKTSLFLVVPLSVWIYTWFPQYRTYRYGSAANSWRCYLRFQAMQQIGQCIPLCTYTHHPA